MIIRKITKDDYNDILELINSLSDTDKKYLALNSKISHIKQVVRSGKHCYVALKNYKIIGFLRESGRPNGYSIVEEIFVRPENRNQGIARNLLIYYHSQFPKNLAKTNAKNVSMIHLLESLGYKTDNREAARIINWYR